MEVPTARVLKFCRADPNRLEDDLETVVTMVQRLGSERETLTKAQLALALGHTATRKLLRELRDEKTD